MQRSNSICVVSTDVCPYHTEAHADFPGAPVPRPTSAVLLLTSYMPNLPASPRGAADLAASVNCGVYDAAAYGADVGVAYEPEVADRGVVKLCVEGVFAADKYGISSGADSWLKLGTGAATAGEFAVSVG